MPRLAVLLLVALAASGCLGSGSTHSAGSVKVVLAARRPGCPRDALRLPRDAVAKAADAALHAGGHPPSTVIEASALATSAAAGTRGSEVLVQCGTATARRTVVVDLFYPSMLPSASLSQGTVFVSYFPSRGYRIWEVAH